MNDPARNPYISPENVGSNSVSHFGSSIRAQVRVGQIITFALVQGTLMIAGIMLYVTVGQQANAGNPPNNERLLLIIGLAAAVLAPALGLIVGKVIRNAAISEFHDKCGPDDANVSPEAASSAVVGQLMTKLQSATLVGQASMEGAAVINSVFLMLGENMLHVAIVAVMLVGIVLQTPTVGKRQAAIDAAMR